MTRCTRFSRAWLNFFTVTFRAGRNHCVVGPLVILGGVSQTGYRVYIIMARSWLLSLSVGLLAAGLVASVSVLRDGSRRWEAHYTECAQSGSTSCVSCSTVCACVQWCPWQWWRLGFFSLRANEPSRWLLCLCELFLWFMPWHKPNNCICRITMIVPTHPTPHNGLCMVYGKCSIESCWIGSILCPCTPTGQLWTTHWVQTIARTSISLLVLWR